MDDTFGFLTKIYSELTEFRKETDSRLNKIEIALEHDVTNSMFKVKI